ncbi:hypothetical protein RvY_10347 [Ramazzottius varieornatus]|uniref:glutathione transferase n=1 Tax=Ramazzottius varieornatus TaxID=947166 RepID=A0A1D1VEX3_RAMVA|nr:hypothetical protein RvY_10347 [Ramazzottius varieornatus]
MAPKVTLHYFNLRGRAEPIRWILAYSGEDWTDHRIEFSEWPAVKSIPPFGQLPYIEIEGQTPLAQAYAIMRYLATQYGLAGADEWEAGEIDALADYAAEANTVLRPYAGAMMAKDEKKAQQIADEITETTIKPFLEKYEKTLQNNQLQSGGEFLVGNKPSWVDFVVVQLMDETLRLKSDLLEQHPLLKGLCERVHNLDGIKDFLETRPDTPL